MKNLEVIGPKGAILKRRRTTLPYTHAVIMRHEGSDAWWFVGMSKSHELAEKMLARIIDKGLAEAGDKIESRVVAVTEAKPKEVVECWA